MKLIKTLLLTIFIITCLLIKVHKVPIVNHYKGNAASPSLDFKLAPLSYKEWQMSQIGFPNFKSAYNFLNKNKLPYSLSTDLYDFYFQKRIQNFKDEMYKEFAFVENQSILDKVLLSLYEHYKEVDFSMGKYGAEDAFVCICAALKISNPEFNTPRSINHKVLSSLNYYNEDSSNQRLSRTPLNTLKKQNSFLESCILEDAALSIKEVFSKKQDIFKNYIRYYLIQSLLELPQVNGFFIKGDISYYKENPVFTSPPISPIAKLADLVKPEIEDFALFNRLSTMERIAKLGLDITNSISSDSLLQLSIKLKSILYAKNSISNLLFENTNKHYKTKLRILPLQKNDTLSNQDLSKKYIDALKVGLYDIIEGYKTLNKTKQYSSKKDLSPILNNVLDELGSDQIHNKLLLDNTRLFKLELLSYKANHYKYLLTNGTKLLKITVKNHDSKKEADTWIVVRDKREIISKKRMLTQQELKRLSIEYATTDNLERYFKSKLTNKHILWLIIVAATALYFIKTATTKRSIKTIIYGGSFDPFHVGHLSVVKRILDRYPGCKLIIAPTHQNPFKKNNPVSLDHRVRMCKLVLEAEGIVVKEGLGERNESGVFISKTPYKYSVELLDKLRSSGNKNKSLYWVIGEDLKDEVKNWKYWEKKGCRVLVLDFIHDISSTKIRNLESSPHEAIVNYIKKHCLYKKD